MNTKIIYKERVGKAIVYALLAIWALIVLFPFYWMLLTSVKSYGAYNAEYIPKIYTLSPTLQNYIDLGLRLLRKKTSLRLHKQCLCYLKKNTLTI